jgi:hypothetical protein
MTRFTIEGSPISVAYGYDEPLDNVFLSVFDERLKYDSAASDGVNSITEKIGVKDGGGSYFDLHTGQYGFGLKVSHDIMRTYLARFGVTQNNIDNLYKNNKNKAKNENKENNKKTANSTEPIKSSLNEKSINKIIKKCSKCNTKTSTVCVNCHFIHYCSKKCQTKDWPIHKSICNSLPFPEKNSNIKSVYGVLLPEDSDKPVLVNVKLDSAFDSDDDSHFYKPNTDEFLGKYDTDHRYVGRNPKNDKNLNNTLVITFREEFGIDGISKTNKAVEKLTKNCCPFEWKGPILITKFRGIDLRSDFNYLDVEMNDIEDIIDYFSLYGKNE